MEKKEKHTPGPWKAIRADLHGDEDDQDPKRWSIVVDGPKRFFIATIENGAPGDTCKTEEANARLLAAAPDLLEAAKSALIRIQVMTPLSTCEEDLVEAIAKAEGKKPKFR